ncbi:MAG: S8 family serine peptidase [Eubacteriaceae bacterium]
MKKRILAVVLCCLMLFFTMPISIMAQVESDEALGTPGVDYVEGEAIVCVNGGSSQLLGKSRRANFEIEDLMSVGSNQNTNESMRRSQMNKELVLVKSSQDTQTLISELQSNPYVEYAEPNYIIEPYAITEPTDPFYNYQWGLDNKRSSFGGGVSSTPGVDMKVLGAWEQVGNTVSETPVVVVLDSGVDYNHEDLSPIMWDDGERLPGLVEKFGSGKYGYNALNTRDTGENPSDPMDTDIGHGTHCAGIIGAQWNTVGVAGVSPNVEIMAVKFLSNNPKASAMDGAIRGYSYIQAAKAAGANVVAINNSWGPVNYDGIRLHAISTAVTAVGEQGVVSIFAAGNSNTNNDLNTGGEISSAYSIQVGAMESEGNRSPFSNYGEKRVDVFAPGSQILSTTTTDTTKPNDEHSMPAKYLPSLMPETESYFYENFEMGEPKVSLKLFDKNGEEVLGEEGSQKVLKPGDTSETGTQISLDSIENGDDFFIEMSFKKEDLNFLSGDPLNIAMTLGFDNAMQGEVFFAYYQDAQGNWTTLDSTSKLGERNLPVYFKLTDFKWNQVSYKIKEGTNLLENEGEFVVIRLKPTAQKMAGKTSGAVFRLDDVGFGKSTIPYCYSDGTSMATPMVTGIAALLASKANDEGGRAYDIKEICARIKGGVNRVDAVNLSDKSISQGFVDADAVFDDSKLVPVLDTLKTEGNTGVLTGYFFREMGTVTIDGMSVNVTSWNDQSITFDLPDGVSGLNEIGVTSDAGLYGRNFFSITPNTIGYQEHSVPNIVYEEDFYGYPLTSANAINLSSASVGTAIFNLRLIVETSKIILEKYDTVTDEWCQIPLPEGMDKSTESISMAGGKTKLYLNYSKTFGDTSQPMLGVYDTINNVWTEVVTESKTYATLVVYQNQLLSIGGETITWESRENFDTTTSKNVEIIDPETGKVMGMLPDLPDTRSKPLVFASGKTLVVLGGTSSYLRKIIGEEVIEYTNSMTFDGENWTLNSDDFIAKTNPSFDPEQTLNYGFGAVDDGLILTGPVQNLGTSEMIDTWRFNLNGSEWTADETVLYCQEKTTKNMGTSCNGRYYALAYTGKEGKPLVLRSIPVSYTGPTEDPKGKGENPTPQPPQPKPQPTPEPTIEKAGGVKTPTVKTGVLQDFNLALAVCIGLLVLCIGSSVIIKKKMFKK